MSEIYKNLISTAGYAVSNHGNIIGRRKTQLSQCMNNRGFLLVNTVHGIRYVHRLVAEAFVPINEDINLFHVHHKDGNRLNNLPENLEWVRVPESMLRRKSHK